MCVQVHAAHLHGTGTPLGDPIEMGAVQAVLLAKGRGESQPPEPGGAQVLCGTC